MPGRQEVEFGGGPRQSRLAVASLLISLVPVFMGSLVLLGVPPALLGLPLGVLALRRIRASHGHLTGGHLAGCSIALSTFWLLIAVLWLAMNASMQEWPRMDDCSHQMRQLALAAHQYAQDHDGRLPPAEWEPALLPYARDPGIVLCPSDDEAPSYVLNPAVTGRRLDSVAEPDKTWLFVEADGQRLAYRHKGGMLVAFVDGRVTWPRREEVRRLPGVATVPPDGR